MPAHSVTLIGMDDLEVIHVDPASVDLSELQFSGLSFDWDPETTSLEKSLFDVELCWDTSTIDADGLAEDLDCWTPEEPLRLRNPIDWGLPIRAINRGLDSLWFGSLQRVDDLLSLFANVARTFSAAVLLMIFRFSQGGRFALGLPSRAVRWVKAAPGAFLNWGAYLPWDRMLTVRRGFLIGAVGGFSVASSTIWALSTLPYFPGQHFEPTSNFSLLHDFTTARLSIPSELAWFFIQFPYLSDSAKVRSKNHHTFIVSDSVRKKDYVVSLGQRFRRVEIYPQDGSHTSQTLIYKPGSKKTVWFKGPRVVGQATTADGNLWMWRTPLWNPLHLKIYGLADMWLDSPFKRYSCAGFMHKFLEDAGVHVPILDAWDVAKQRWTRVTFEELEPGDIITINALSAEHRRFWHHRVTHVGVYIGHGKIIHAATSSRGARAWVRIADVEDFRKRIDKILRPPELL